MFIFGFVSSESQTLELFERATNEFAIHKQKNKK